MRKRLLVIGLFALLSVCRTDGFSQQTNFINYTVENGLDNNIVFAATQDAKGLLWFGTSTGVNRFDGNKFQYYSLPQKNNTTTRYLQVQFILADYKKSIWAASASALYAYNIKKDVFELVPAVNNWLEKNKTITSIATANNNIDLLIGNNAGFIVYQQADNKIITAEKFNQFVRSVFQDAKGVIWIGTGKGVHRFIVNGNVISELPITSPVLASIANEAITGISQDAAGRYWLVSADKGVFVYDELAQTIVQPQLPNSNGKVYAVKDVHHDKENKISYISLDGGGLCMVDASLNLQKIFQTNEDDPTSLSSNAVYDVFSDSYNRIWVTTYGGGINVMAPAVQPFVNFTHQVNNNNSLSNNAAKAITEDNAGNLWFGTRKGISKYYRATQSWVHFNEERKPQGYTSDNILALQHFEGEVWAAVYGGGLMRFNANTNTVNSYKNNPSDSSSIGTDYVYAVMGDSKKRIWSGGIRGPVSYFDKNSNRFFRLATTVAQVNCIIENSKGQILFGCDKGVYVADGTSLKNYFQDIITERILYMLEYSPGTYWLGTLGNGIIVATKEKGIEKRITTADGLPSDVVCGLLKDKNGDIWVGTSKGLAHYQKKMNNFTTYTKADGLAGSQINYGAVYATRNGEMIVGTTNGFSLFNPEGIRAQGYKPIIIFTGLSINNKLAPPSNADSPLDVQIDETEKLVLTHSQNSFSIDFVNSSPSVSGAHLYSWKLEGFDKDWSQPSVIPTASYTNLNSGKYTLLVKAFGKGQAEGAEVRKLPIIIKAPWWRTGWAYAGYLLLALAGIMAAYNFYIVKATRKQYSERLKLNTSISHEIRTPLTLIKGPVNALAKSAQLSENEKANLELAKKNIEKLEGIISQFIDYQKTGMRKMQMQVIKANVVNVVDEITASFIPLMKEKNIHFTYTKPSEEIQLLFDKDKIEKVLNNLLSNAVKYTPAQKDVSIQLSKSGNDFIMEVADTGIGIPKNQQQYIFKGYFRADNTVNLKETGSGIGLNVAKELVEMHKGKLEFKSEAGRGTVFSVRLPIVNEVLQQYLVKDGFMGNAQAIPSITNNKPGKNTGSILIAEDNDELRQYLKAELENAGYNVTDAANGAMAHELLQNQSADLVITDVMMPEMNGFQLCTAIKRDVKTGHIPVIMLTAIHDRDYLLEGYRSGADDYVKKPFDLTYIVTRIENLLQNRTRFGQKVMSVFEQEEAIVSNDAEVAWLKKATKIIVDNMAEPDFSVEKLSSLMAMSRPVLFRKFKAISGESPQQYISKLRMQRAVELLHKGGLNINEVAFECGFADAKYFSTQFKKHFDKTPSDYLREISDKKSH